MYSKSYAWPILLCINPDSSIGNVAVLSVIVYTITSKWKCALSSFPVSYSLQQPYEENGEEVQEEHGKSEEQLDE